MSETNKKISFVSTIPQIYNIDLNLINKAYFNIVEKWKDVATVIIITLELYLTRVKHIDYWSPSSFHNGPPTINSLSLVNLSVSIQYYSI